MIETALVYIRKADGTNDFVGCGTLVDGPFIATCRHVWRDAGGEEAGKVLVEFPRSLDKSGTAVLREATVADACDGSMPVLDLVLLECGILPVGLWPLVVAPDARFEIGAAEIYAYVASSNTEATVSGKIGHHTTAQGLRQFTGENLASYWSERGSSGSPAFVNGGMQLAGLLRLSEIGRDARHEAFIIPGTAIRPHVERAKLQRALAQTAQRENTDIEVLRPMFERLQQQGVPLADMPDKAIEALEAWNAQRSETPAPSNDGADIAATITVARAKQDPAEAREILKRKLAEENQTRRQRLLPLLMEQYQIERTTFDYSAAKSTLQTINGLDPDDTWALVELGDLERIYVALSDALVYYRTALKRERATNNQIRISLCLNKIGDVLRARNDLAGALTHYEEGLGIARSLAAADPSNSGRARDVSVSLSRISDVLRARNDLVGALTHYEEGLGIARSLAAADPSNSERARDVSVSLDRIGDVLFARNDLAGALTHYEEGLGIRRSLAAADPSNSERARDVAMSLHRVGLIAERQGRLADACAAYREGKTIIHVLLAAAPDIAALHEDLAFFEQGLKDAKCG